jgi:phosphotriesterase-related protein
MGAWIAMDGVDAGNVTEYVSRLRGFREQGLLERVLLSHDAGWYSPGEVGGTFRPFDALFTQLLPALRDAGFTDADIRQLTATNPARAFARSVRRAS